MKEPENQAVPVEDGLVRVGARLMDADAWRAMAARALDAARE